MRARSALARGFSRPMLVGQAPSRSSKGMRAFDGRSSAFLDKLTGLDAVCDRFERVNLIKAWPGRSKCGKGDAFPMAEARRAAEELMERARGRIVILCGAAVARAFGFETKPKFVFFIEGDACFSVIPHPSQVNRWWNDATNAKLARKFFRTLIGCIDEKDRQTSEASDTRDRGTFLQRDPRDRGDNRRIHACGRRSQADP